MRSFVLLLAASTVFAQSTADSTGSRAWDLLTQATQDTHPARRVLSTLAMGVVRPDAKSVALVEGMLTALAGPAAPGQSIWSDCQAPAKP